jgi:hypothetical protein
MSSRRAAFPLLFLTYFLAWAAANAPALRQAWWFADDFGQENVFTDTSFAHHLEQGRPGQLLWMLTLRLDAGEGRVANVALRLLQGGLHVLTAALIADLLRRRTRRRATLLAGLPFLLWPYNGEAVLWRSAGTYPVAALLSIVALQLLRRARRPAVVAPGVVALLVAAMLTQQLAALAAGVVWCFLAGLDLQLGARRRLRTEALTLLNGYLWGAAASYSVACWAWPLPGLGRIEPVFDPWGKLGFLWQATATFFAQELFYPRWLAVLQVAFLALLVAVPFVASGPRDRRQRVLLVLSVATAFVTPYAAELPVIGSHVSWRALYLAPLVFAGAWTALDVGLPQRAGLRRLGAAMLVVMAVAYGGLARAAAQSFVTLYEADRGMVRDLEAQARAECAHSVYVASDLGFASMNPYEIDFRWGGGKLSALLTDMTSVDFLRRFSWLHPSEDPPVEEACLAVCPRVADASHFTVVGLARPKALCLCPPGHNSNPSAAYADAVIIEGGDTCRTVLPGGSRPCRQTPRARDTASDR